MEDGSLKSTCSGEYSKQSDTAPQTCEAAEIVKRLLGPIDFQLMSDFHICAANHFNQREPLLDLMTRSLKGYIEQTQTKLRRLEGRNDYGRLDPVKCQECGRDCLSVDILEQHISELHDPFTAANSKQPPSYKCPVPWCSERLPCPDSRRLHAYVSHGLLANSLIFSVLKQT